MINVYTEKKNLKDWIFQNDLYFNLNTGNEEMSQKEIDLIQQVDAAKLTPDIIQTGSRNFCNCPQNFRKNYLYYIATGKSQKVTLAEKIMEFFH